MKFNQSIILGLGLFVLPVILHSQSAPDSVVQITAENQGLQRMARADLPLNGTFWLMTSNGFSLPMPCAPVDLTLPVYAVSDTVFIVDDTGGLAAVNLHRAGYDTVEGIFAAQANGVINIIDQTEANQVSRAFSMAMGMDFPLPGIGGDGGGGSGNYFTSDSFTYTFDTNQLWLEITNVTADTTFANLHNATNQVYAIWSTTNLASAWQVETELWPTDTNCQPFNVPTLGRQDLYLRAEDWTGVDSDGDGLPDWWEWYWFQDLTHSANDLDANGNSLLSDYQNYANGTITNDPNAIAFSIESGSEFVNTNTVNVQLRIAVGAPSYYALYVNSATATNWLPYTSANLTAVLGTTDGVYNVVIGLKGIAPTATESWESLSFTFDRAAPSLAILKPGLVNASATVAKPYLQLTGLADKPLTFFSYDISNAAGIFTNQDCFLTDQVFDTNRLDFTTNYFQAYDIPLTTNANNITLRVTDRAGNTTTTNFTVTLDYNSTTNPPATTLTWPQEGMAVSGTNITIRGTMSDETGTVMATVVNGDGTTNVVTGIVERNGMFWLENVPLNGTNLVSVQATDAAGHVTTTNFTILPATVELTIGSTPTGDALHQFRGQVSGTVGDPDAIVTVNGTNATVSTEMNEDGTYNWNADGVTIGTGGTATFDAQAVTPNGAINNASSNSAKDTFSLPVEHYILKFDREVYRGSYSGTSFHSRYKHFINALSGNFVSNTNFSETGDTIDYMEDSSSWSLSHTFWSDVFEWVSGTNSSGGDGFQWGFPPHWDDNQLVTAMPDKDVWGAAPPDVYGQPTPPCIFHYFANNVHHKKHWDLGNGNSEDAELAIAVSRTTVKLFTGGKSVAGRKSLFCIAADAQEYGVPQYDSWMYVPNWNIPSASLKVLGKSVGSDGNLWVALPDGSMQDITVTAPARHFNAEATPGKYHPYITANDVPLDPVAINVTNCVGQKIIFKLAWSLFAPSFVTNENNWVLPGKYVNAKKWFYPAFPPDGTGMWQITTCDPEITYSGGGGYDVNEPYYSTYQQENWPLTQPETGAWWVSDGPKAVTCFPKLTFSNGQKVSLGDVHGNLYMLKPFITRVDPNGAYNGPYNGVVQWPYLWLNGGPMDFHVYISKTYPGRFGVTQLVNMYSESFVKWSSTYGAFYLDKNQEFYEPEKDVVLDSYPFNDEYPIGAHVYDSPGQQLILGEASYTGNWQDYVRFTPAGDGSIPITLGRIDWAWSAAALENPSWNMTANHVDAPALHTDDSFPFWSKGYPNGD